MITVILASHNGAAVITKTLDGLVHNTAPVGGWKLVVVDNASTDGTGDLARSYTDKLPITVLSEPKRGKNKAVNLGLSHAEGDLFVFCDDDVVAVPDWLVEWRRVADAHKDYDLFAGSIQALWPYEPPRWLVREKNLCAYYGLNDYMHEGPCEADGMFGANMAIRASVFEAGTRFDENIGPDGSTSYPMGSETEFTRRLAALGCKCWFAGGPSVSHIIRQHQMDREWLLLRGYRLGRGNAHMRLPHHYDPRRLSRKNALRSWLYPLFLRLSAQDEAWARHWEWMEDQGYEDGFREISGQPPRWLKKGRDLYVVPRFRSAKKGLPRGGDTAVATNPRATRNHGI